MSNSSTTPHCTELVIYRVKPEQLSAYHARHQAVQQTLKNQPGFISMSTQQDIHNTLQFCDQVIWQDQTCALDAFSRFKQLPCAQPFMDCIDHVICNGHFTCLAAHT